MDAWLYSGFYPRIHDQGLNPTQALADYFATYIERDLRQLSELRNLSAFQGFVRLCAGRVGQLLNVQSLGHDAGVSHTTARQWLSLLEASYVVFRLQPYHGDLRKRLTKSPKLYFYDVGLAAYLLGIARESHLAGHPLRGNLFENLVVTEVLKYRLHGGHTSNLNFYRDSAGHEVDLIYTIAQHPLPIEVKAGRTVGGDFFRGLRHFLGLVGPLPASPLLVYGGSDRYEREGIRVSGITGLVQALEDMDRRLS